MLACIVLLGCTSAYAQYDAVLPEVITSAGMGLHGRVEEMTETYTDMEDAEGLGAVTQTDMYAFDKKNRLKTHVQTQYEGRKNKDKHIYTTQYHYSRNGALASVARYEDGSRRDSTVMEYSRGKLRNQRVYDDKDRMQKRVQYTWSSRGALMTVRHRNSDNAIIRMIKISYSDDGSTVNQEHLDEHLKQLYRLSVVTQPDKEGGERVMRFEYEKPDTCTGMISYTTDAEGHKIEETVMDEHKNVTEYRTAVYDRQGNPDSVILFTDRKWRIQYMHTYDKQGNWTVEAVYYNNTPHHTIGRVMMYRTEADDKSHIKVTEEKPG